mgnify:CR=1 FL=1
MLKKLKYLLLFIIFALVIGCSAQTSNQYADKNNWAFFPESSQLISADVFLICPTVYMGEENSFNMEMNDAKTRASFMGALNMEKGIYENVCSIYAPFYRQAGLNAYSLDSTEAEPYFQLAYSDVKQSFAYYMQECNNGRPLVLAGFSQGSEMLLRLMKDLFQNKSYNDLLVGAYLIGWRITEEDVAQYPYLKMARGADDTGVIISFNSEAESVNTSLLVPRSTLAINPLNWKTTGEYAEAELNLGAVFTDYEGDILKEIPALTGAYLDPERGTLKVTGVSPEDYPPVLDIFEKGVYHLYDYQFFYRNLQQNVALRVDKYIKAHD